MSFPAEEFQDVGNPWFRRKSSWIAAAVLVCLLAAGVGIMTYWGSSESSEVYRLTIEADPNTRIYIGDKLAGTTLATFSWEELIGDEAHKPLAIGMPDLAKMPEFASGAGAKVLDHHTFEGLMLLRWSVNGDRYMMRRADGALDDVLCYVLSLTHSKQPPIHFLLPVRLRKGKGATTVYFNDTGFTISGSKDLLNFRPEETTLRWRFSAAPPPSQFAEEIKAKGLWEPDGTK